MQIDLTLCLVCSHFDQTRLVCTAYPEGVPIRYIFNQEGHFEVQDDQQGSDVFDRVGAKMIYDLAMKDLERAAQTA